MDTMENGEWVEKSVHLHATCAHTHALTAGYLLAAVLARPSSSVAADSSVFKGK